MNEQLKLKYKDELKKELINYYDSLQFDVDIKSQELINANDTINSTETEQENREIIDENIYLIEQIERVLKSNLNDINHYFDSKYNNDLDLDTLINVDYHDESTTICTVKQVKEFIKKNALKSYLICIKYKGYEKFGLHLEFEWYIDQNQLKYIM